MPKSVIRQQQGYNISVCLDIHVSVKCLDKKKAKLLKHTQQETLL